MQAIAGWGYHNGLVPEDATWADPFSEMRLGAALGVLSATISRGTSGMGQHVETSLLAGLVGLLNVQARRYLSLGEIPLPNGNAHPVIAPYGSYATADGPLNIATATQDMWRKLAECLGLEQLIDDSRFADNAARLANRDQLKTLMEEKQHALEGRVVGKNDRNRDSRRPDLQSCTGTRTRSSSNEYHTCDGCPPKGYRMLFPCGFMTE